mmetsp:Transcript_45265/g.125511  ORF Transcript_45265/g.125511 Transcript_45265/m.125511 type:complete len:309 (+) Transcript_45265:198-1124(+)
MEEPPLRLMLYAPSATERAAAVRLRDRRGDILPAGAGFVLDGTGAFSLWTELKERGSGAPSRVNASRLQAASPAATAEPESGAARREADKDGHGSDEDDFASDALLVSVFAQLRRLMGLPPTPWTLLPPRTVPPSPPPPLQPPSSSEGAEPRSPPADILPLEVLALQLGCARRKLDALHGDLAAVRQLEASHARMALLEGRNLVPMRSHAAAAAHLALRAVRRVRLARYADACADAAAGQAAARAALRHPALLPTTYFSEEHTLNVYAPLFLPIGSAVGAAVWGALGAGRRRAGRAAAASGDAKRKVD